MDKSLKPFTPIQQRLLEEYIKDSSSGRAAAIRAGYSPNTASEAASLVLNDERAESYLKEAQERAIKTLHITKERVLQELAVIAFSDPTTIIALDEKGDPVVDLVRLQKDKSGAVEVGVSTMVQGGKRTKVVNVKTIKIADKLSALEKLAKIMGFMTEKVEVSAKSSLIDLIEQSYKESLEHKPQEAPALPNPDIIDVPVSSVEA